MTHPLSYGAAIVGAAEANEIGFSKEPITSLQLHIEAIKNLSEQTGIPINKIEGVFSTGWSTELCEHLGITPKYIDTTAVGGCSFEMHVHHALGAIYAGIIDIALISHGENGHSARALGQGGVNYGRGAGNASPSHEMSMAYGLGSAPSNYAMRWFDICIAMAIRAKIMHTLLRSPETGPRSIRARQCIQKTYILLVGRLR